MVYGPSGVPGMILANELERGPAFVCGFKKPLTMLVKDVTVLGE